MRNKLAVKSSAIGIIAQVVSMILSLISTRIFVQQLGVEIRGINSLLSNCLGLLQLSDLGIGTAIIFALYDPIVNKNTDEINVLMKFYRKVYHWIGFAILALGILMSLGLHIFITETTLDWNYVLLLFYVQLMTCVSTYFFGAYKRNLLYADQNQYINVLVDICMKLVGTVLQIFVLLQFHSYLMFLIIAFAQTVISNIVIAVICNKKYPYLKEEVTQKYDKMPMLLSNVKNVFIGRMGGFVYSSTDNFVISRFAGVVAVGYMANYYDIINAVKSLASSITSPIQPMIGNYIREETDVRKSYDLFLTYTFIRFCIANIVSVSVVVMIGPLMELWLGKEFNLGIVIPLLMVMDAFLGIVQGPEAEFIVVLGLFKNDRNMTIIGMLINLITSIVLTARFGAVGAIIGTVTAQIYFWIARTKIVFGNYFLTGVAKYLRQIVTYIALTGIEIVVFHAIRTNLVESVSWISFFVLCAVCVIVELSVIAIVFGHTKEFAKTVDILKTFLNRKQKSEQS